MPLVAKVLLDLDRLTITLKPGGFEKLASQYFKIRIPKDILQLRPLVDPYKTAKTRRGAIVIEPANPQEDLFDLPASKLKKLVQGMVWRDEHFDGLNISLFQITGAL